MRTRWVGPANAAAVALAVIVGGCGSQANKASPSPRTPEAAGGSLSASCAHPARLTVTRSIDVGRGAGALTVDGNSIWVASATAGTVTRVVGGSRSVAQLGGGPVSLALGNGQLWVALRDAGRVVSLDPATLAKRTETRLPIPVSVLARPDGVWALSLDEVAVWQLAPASGALANEIDSPVSTPIAMVTSGDELWVLGAGGISPINARLGRITRLGFALPGRSLAGLSAFGSQLWLGEPGRRALLRVEVGRVAAAREVSAPDGMVPIATAATACGVWVAGTTGTVALLDPRTGSRLAGPLRIGRTVAALAGSGTGVWASDPVDGRVVNITAAAG